MNDAEINTNDKMNTRVILGTDFDLQYYYYRIIKKKQNSFKNVIGVILKTLSCESIADMYRYQIYIYKLKVLIYTSSSTDYRKLRVQ